MAYGDHNYTLEEVHQILYKSERRLRPTAPINRAHEGHPISRHTEQRENPFDRPTVKQDSTFSSRKSMILGVQEALNSVTGKTELQKLNRGTNTVTIDAPVVDNTGKVFADIVRNPTARQGRRNVPAQGPSQHLQGTQVNRVRIIVDKLDAPEGNVDIHIQTAFPI